MRIRTARIGPKARRALKLASGPSGTTEQLLFALGFSRRMLSGLVRTGLAAAKSEVIKAGDNTIAIIRIRVTGAGRRAIGPRQRRFATPV
ncbi:MAG TPA: hypothetical protein VKP67_19820 [Xanthobacteraceae bacterium]|nr:hypothetical protein [Xanthobacteraceae bacterium]